MSVLVQASTAGASLFAEQGSLAAGSASSSSSGRACSVSTRGSSWRRVVTEHRLLWCVSQSRRTWQARAKPNFTPAKKPVGIHIRAQRVNFKATRKVTIPFKEGPFPANEYLKETERIVDVTFPDSTRIEYLGDQKWRARLRPLMFINITATPSVEMRVSFEKGALRLYSDKLFLDFTGVPDSFAVADFSFLLDGNMRATPRSPKAVNVRHDWDFSGSVSLGLSTDLPVGFALIPEGIVTRAGDEILDRIIGAMEGALLQGIIRDYNIWCRMKSRKKVAKPR